MLGRADYWERWYATQRQTGTTEWYASYADLAPVLARSCAAFERSRCRVLVAGCGTSLLGQQMAADGYARVVNVDFSESAVAEMLARTDLPPNVAYERADVTQLPYAEGSFELVVDKGCADSMLDGGTPASAAAASAMMRELRRVLVPGGLVVVVTPDAERAERVLAGAGGAWRRLACECLRPPEGAGLLFGDVCTLSTHDCYHCLVLTPVGQ
eukprot:m51a1_g2321 hypothetical protein (213) ;mRNA; f:497393-498146